MCYNSDIGPTQIGKPMEPTKNPLNKGISRERMLEHFDMCEHFEDAIDAYYNKDATTRHIDALRQLLPISIKLQRKRDLSKSESSLLLNVHYYMYRAYHAIPERERPIDMPGLSPRTTLGNYIFHVEGTLERGGRLRYKTLLWVVTKLEGLEWIYVRIVDFFDRDLATR